MTYPHIDLSEAGAPRIEGTRTKVKEIVLDHLAHQWTPEEIQRQHPHLSLAQIHAAFTYYYDHETEIDREIDEDLRAVDESRHRLSDDSIRAKLKTAGRRS